MLNIEGNLIRIFGLDKMIIPLLILSKNWLSYKLPQLNKYIFREKLSSLTISYTHYTSTYYNQQNSSSDYILYRSILTYVYEKKPYGCKFSTNPNGNFMFFEPFDEIQISKYIWIISKVNTTNSNCLYTIELISYNSSIDKINKFIRHCIDKYKHEIQKDSIMKSNIKYYKYLGLNNSTHLAMYDEFNFIQTKTFNNIFFLEKEDLVRKIKYFSENEDSYRELGIPWCMGILLHGKPGTGKTSCIKAIAAMTQRHIVDVALSKIKTQKE
jgi:ATP-dependent Zn protease